MAEIPVDNIDFVLDHILIPVLVLDHESRIRKMNPPWLQLVGEKDVSYIHNKNYVEFLDSLVVKGIYTPSLKEEIKNILYSFTQGNKKVFRSEFNIGEKWYVCNLQPLFGDGGYKGVVIAHNNITEWKRRESVLEEEKQKSLESHRRQSIFLANLNHELKSPLNAILGFSQLLKEQIQKDPALNSYIPMIENIYEGATHLDSIVSRILQLVKVQSGNLVLYEDRIMPRRLVELSINMATAIYPQRKIIQNLCATALDETLRCDKHLIIEVLMNLIINALKYSDGDVGVECGVDAERNLQFTVTDTGSGMTDHEIAVALEPFGQNKHSRLEKMTGLGLGIPLVHEIMKLHGGALEIDSVKGQGTSVSVVFPGERIRI